MLDEVPSTQTLRMPGWAVTTWSSRWAPATESCTLAAVTSTASRRPSVSVTMLRFLPTIFSPASMPWSAACTSVEVFTLCASITQADGWARLPSFCHFAKYP